MIGGHGLEFALNELPFLEGMSGNAISLIEECAKDVTFDSGSYVFHEGDRASFFYILRKGNISLEVRVPGRNPFIVETVQEKDVLGWSWLMPACRWSFSARANSNVEAVAVDTQKLLAEMAGNPEFATLIYQRFIPIMGERLSAARLRMIDMFVQPRGV